MEGDEIFASIDSLWFYSSVLLPPSPKQKNKNCSAVPGELQPRKQYSTGSHGADGDCGHQDPGCVRETAPVAARRRAAARSRELEERMDIWQEQYWRQTPVAAPARCSPSPMPPPCDSPAMKAHLRSWAHAVACSVR